MNTYAQQPKDFYLSSQETQHAVALYMFGQAKLTGESAADIQRRMAGATGGPNLLDYLGSLRVVREKYAERVEFKPQATKSDRVDRLKGISDEIRRTILGNRMVEGDAVHMLREWQSLKGDKSKGLLLLGGAGAGKTLHASALLMGNVLDIEPDGYFVGESLLAMHLQSGTKAEKQDALKPLRATPLLVVDYMGQPKHYPRWESTIMEFLRLRWEAGRKCVLTHRGTIEDFRSTYGADAWATVERFCTVVQVKREG